MPQKRPFAVMDTARELQNRGFDVEVVFAGDGPLRGSLETYAASSGLGVRFLGWLTDWRAELRRCDCLLLPSVVEGFGIVLVEAAEIGLPVVCPVQALGSGDAVVPWVTGALAVSPRPRHLAAAVVQAIQLSERADEDAGIGGWLGWFGREHGVDVLEEVLSTIVRESHG